MIDNDASRRSKIKNVIRVSSGSLLEMYDFIVFGLINATGNRAMPGAWMSCAAALGLVGAIVANRAQVVAQKSRSEANRIGAV